MNGSRFAFFHKPNICQCYSSPHVRLVLKDGKLWLGWCSLPCLSAKSWQKSIIPWLPRLTQISSLKTKIWWTYDVLAKSVNVCRHSFIHTQQRGEQLAKRHQNIWETLQHKHMTTHTHAHIHHIHIHIHSEWPFRFMFFFSYRDGRPTICHITHFHFVYNPLHNMIRHHIKERGLTGEGRHTHWHTDRQA